uniref:Uncharacterized protein n=1 Tax=Anguilla anguilla TaxID=7936 RepID=A0A0E9T0Y4_ANGAN
MREKGPEGSSTIVPTPPLLLAVHNIVYLFCCSIPSCLSHRFLRCWLILETTSF